MATHAVPEAKSARIRVLPGKKFRYSPNGWDQAVVLKEGEEADVRPLVAKCGLDEDLVELIEKDDNATQDDQDDDNPDGPKSPKLPKAKKK
jgi:hypothetical protein